MRINPQKPSLYVHIPFCAAKCPYCSFPVVVGQAHREDDYLSALAREMRTYQGALVSSIYIGGGTPSVLSDDGIRALCALIKRNFTVEGGERTFELNPESVTPAKAAVLRAEGFTRVSFGLQSFDRERLAYLGRGHGVEAGHAAFDLLRAAGFDNINVDLMFGFPGQSTAELDADIDAVLALGSEHVSLYALNIEKRSALHVRGEKVSDEAQADLYRQVCERLNAAGVLQYEVSNFARPGLESAHNMNYWQGGEYIGLGMGAHSHLDGARFWNADIFPLYLKMISDGGSAETGREKLSAERKMMETFLFGLRMNAGVDAQGLEAHFGVKLGADTAAMIDDLQKEGLLVCKDGRMAATDKGRLVLDEMAARLI